MPRRTRGHIYRKRPAPGTASRPANVAEPADAGAVATDPESEAVEVAVRPEPAPYVRRQAPSATLARPAAPSGTVRASRALVTDYGYVVSELQRIGITFGGLIVLLLVVSRLLR